MQSFYTSLNHMDLLAVSGEDSQKFLQGQLTCELEELHSGSIQHGAACNNKGRVYTNFRILHLETRYLLSMQPGMLSITTQTLEKYIPFYKAELSNAGNEFNRIGLAGIEAEALLKSVSSTLPAPNQSISVENALLINIGKALPRYEIWLPENQANPFTTVLESLEQKNQSAWDALDQQEGLAFIQPDESSLYTPEELNLDLAGFVSFSKGCYTGQEIVARMHYRGKAGKRLYSVTFSSPKVPDSLELHDSANKRIGEIINLVNIREDEYQGFAVIKTSTELAQDFQVGGNDPFPAKLLPLEYPE